MGYTHYWRRKKEITIETMRLIVNDFQKTIFELDKHIDLAGGNGSDEPIISVEEVCFNGREKCGHEKHELGITWPSKIAGGVAVPFQENAENGSWFAGAQLDKRMCGGDCSHESVYFPRVLNDDCKPIEKIAYYNGNVPVYNSEDEVGLYFEFCKTAFKPYDLAVITFLIIAKSHLKELLIVESDGEDGHWFDGKMLCQLVLGYGLHFNFDKKTGRLERKEEEQHEKTGSNH
jgi:hypothetical protein